MLVPGFDHQTPLKADVLRDGQGTSTEQRPQPLVQSVVQFGPPLGIADQLNMVAPTTWSV